MAHKRLGPARAWAMAVLILLLWAPCVLAARAPRAASRVLLQARSCAPEPQRGGPQRPRCASFSGGMPRQPPASQDCPGAQPAPGATGAAGAGCALVVLGVADPPLDGAVSQAFTASLQARAPPDPACAALRPPRARLVAWALLPRRARDRPRAC